MTVPEVLVVENELVVALDLEMCLRSIGCNVAAIVTTAEEAVETACRLKPDIVLMDICLEGSGDGIEAAECIRKRTNIPLIFLTAFGDNETIRRAVHAQPAAYLIKPFDERELAAAVQLALHKREVQARGLEIGAQSLGTLASEASVRPSAVTRIGDLSLDFAGRRVFAGSKEISLTRKEFDLLQCLAKHTGLPLSPEKILAEVWGPQFGHYVQTLRVHIGHLRRKIGPASGILIEAVRGIGYRLVETHATVSRASSDAGESLPHHASGPLRVE